VHVRPALGLVSGVLSEHGAVHRMGEFQPGPVTLGPAYDRGQDEQAPELKHHPFARNGDVSGQFGTASLMRDLAQPRAIGDAAHAACRGYGRDLAIELSTFKLQG